MYIGSINNYGDAKMIKKVKVEFTEKSLTGNAGLVHFGRFAKKLGIKNLLEKHISISRAKNAVYQTTDVILMLMFAVLSGAKHISHVAIIRNDSVIRTIFKWATFPVDCTFGRIFKLFKHSNCQELSNVESIVRKKVWGKKWFGRITFDMDSSVKGVFGSQEGACKGYNPKKKGQKSYHPLLCFIAENRECFHNWFRSGNSYSANGCDEFMKECLAKLPKRIWKIVVRADSAFFDGKLLNVLEKKGCGYTIKVNMKGLVKLLESQEWKKAKNQPDFEVTKFEYKCSDWKRVRRFVAVRRIVETVIEEDDLFKIPKVKYEYFCYVSNMDMTPWKTHKYYGKRSTSENWIEWCKNQMACGNILTNNFWANSAIFQTCILSYNMMVWMIWLNSDKKSFREEPNTIRQYLIRIPARLLNQGREWKLKLERDFFYKPRWLEIENALNELSFI